VFFFLFFLFLLSCCGDVCLTSPFLAHSFIVSVIKVEVSADDTSAIPVKRPSLALAEIEAYIHATLNIESAGEHSIFYFEDRFLTFSFLHIV